MTEVAQTINTCKVNPRFRGEVFTELPEDLYIPPEALEIFLEAFEGPLDLLLYIIKKHNMDIVDIPIAEITKQYMSYIDLMRDLRLDLASEYLVMAATLAEIKSRMLLPQSKFDDESEVDPRADLMRRLQEYERFKQAADELNELNRLERDNYLVKVATPHLALVKPLPDVAMDELIAAMRRLLQQADRQESHHIQRETLSIRERMSKILDRLNQEKFTPFVNFFNYREGRMGVVVTFIAILELLRQSMIDIVQNDAFTPIHLKAVA